MMTMNRDRICTFRTANLARCWMVAMTLAASLMLGSSARAQTSAPAGANAAAEKPTAKSHPNDPMIWDVDRMMEEAVQQIARRYNLNKDQEQYTRLLLSKRVRQFLEQYEGEVRELLQDSMDMRQGKKESSPELLKIWAMRAEPIYDAAKGAILEGNKEWSQVLTPEQMKVYDRDRNMMEANFTSVTRTLSVWKDGKGILPLSRQTATASNKGQVSPTPTPIRTYEPEDNWLAYVNTFVRTYHLDEKQAIAARDKIHKEQFDLAKKYRSQNQTKFDEVRKQLLSRDRSGPNTTTLLRRKKELEKPIRTLFIAMNDRLNALPSSQQKANVDQEALKQLDTMYRSMAAEMPSASKLAHKGETPTTQDAKDNASDAPVPTSAPSEKAAVEKDSKPAMEKGAAEKKADTQDGKAPGQ